jgi:DNA-binding CsgD family transcriptional regulator
MIPRVFQCRSTSFVDASPPPVKSASSQTISLGSMLAPECAPSPPPPSPASNHKEEGDARAHSLWGVQVLSGNTDLTSKEWAVTALLSQGSTNTEIAASIHIPEPVVQDYVRTLLQKTGCWNRTEIALWYVKMGVEQERRFSDRRLADSKADERSKGRRRSPERSARANEQHDLNLDE